MTTTPAAFIGHGSPMNTLERNEDTLAWRAFGASVERPRAVLVVSAHWYVPVTAVTAMERPRVIHDFFGFPDELFAFDYPAPGAPDLAAEVAEVAKPRWVGLDQSAWGLDHGTWSVLAHVFPEADVPVVQLSINAEKPLADHLDLARRLAPLRERGVMIIGSGNVVHNLRRIDWAAQGRGEPWAERFDEAARQVLVEDPGDVGRLLEHPDHDLAVPIDDHFLPFVYVAGLAAEGGTTPEQLVSGCTMGSLSMASYTLDAGCPPVTGDGTGAAGLPDPEVIPPRYTNM